MVPHLNPPVCHQNDMESFGKSFFDSSLVVTSSHSSFKGKIGKFKQWTLRHSSHSKESSDDFISSMMEFLERKKLEESSPIEREAEKVSEVTLIPRSKKAKVSSDSDDLESSRSQNDKKMDTPTLPSPSPTTRADLIALSMRGRDVGREGVWDDEQTTDSTSTSPRIVSEETLQMISKTEKQLRRREQKEQQKKRLSDWDQLLDSGRQKKIKTGRPNSLDTYLKQESGVNQFQEYQNFVQDKRAHGEYEDYRTHPIEKKSPTGRHQDSYEDDEDEERGDEYDEVQEQRRSQQKVSRNQSFAKMNGKKFHDRKFPNKNHRPSGNGKQRQMSHGKKGSFKPHHRGGK